MGITAERGTSNVCNVNSSVILPSNFLSWLANSFLFFERLKRRGVGNSLAPSAGLGGVGAAMTALFDEQSLAIVAVLFICTCTYIKMKAPTLLNTREG